MRNWICPECGTRDPYTYPQHVVCRLCSHVAPCDEAEPEHLANLVRGLFRRWGNPRVLEAYCDPEGGVFAERMELEAVGFVFDAVLELVFHAEGYVAARPDPDHPDLFRLSDGAGVFRHESSRFPDEALTTLAGLERALEILESTLGNGTARLHAAEIERLRAIVAQAHGTAPEDVPGEGIQLY